MGEGRRFQSRRGRLPRELRNHLRHLRETVIHVDATLRLCDPNGDPMAIVGKRPYKRVKLFGAGKLNRLILDAMREGEQPMATGEIVAAIVAELGYGADAAKGMTNRVWANLAYLTRAGRILKEGERAATRWALKT